MKTVKVSTLEDAIQAASAEHAAAWGAEREWLCAIPADSYGEREHRIEIRVLQGSPPRAIMIVNHGHKSVSVYDSSGRRVSFYLAKGVNDGR